MSQHAAAISQHAISVPAISVPAVSIAATVMTAADTTGGCRSVHGTYPECPLCGGALHAEHAHFKCGGCGWRDSCCD